MNRDEKEKHSKKLRHKQKNKKELKESPPIKLLGKKSKRMNVIVSII